MGKNIKKISAFGFVVEGLTKNQSDKVLLAITTELAKYGLTAVGTLDNNAMFILDKIDTRPPTVLRVKPAKNKVKNFLIAKNSVKGNSVAGITNPTAMVAAFLGIDLTGVIK